VISISEEGTAPATAGDAGRPRGRGSDCARRTDAAGNRQRQL
jgi:hypothetical protein